MELTLVFQIYEAIALLSIYAWSRNACRRLRFAIRLCILLSNTQKMRFKATLLSSSSPLMHKWRLPVSLLQHNSTVCKNRRLFVGIWKLLVRREVFQIRLIFASTGPSVRSRRTDALQLLIYSLSWACFLNEWTLWWKCMCAVLATFGTARILCMRDKWASFLRNHWVTLIAFLVI